MNSVEKSTYKQVVKKLAELIKQEGEAIGLNGINRGPAFLTDVTFEVVSISDHGDNEKTKKAAIKKVAALLALD